MMMLATRVLRILCLVGVVLVGLGHSAWAARVPEQPTVGVEQKPSTAATANGATQPADAYLRDEPPTTLWDRRQQDPNFKAMGNDKVYDDHSFLLQLVRTLTALCGVLFLLWACARVIGPKISRSIMGRRALQMQVTDRLNLDGRTTLVRVTLADGRSHLIACGDHAITLIDTLPAPSEQQADHAAPFAERMQSQEVVRG